MLSADYSREALRSVEKNLSGSRTAYVDMRTPLPFPDGTFGVIVSSMALHYFDEATMLALMGEVRRILSPGGVLHARVSSVNDVHYGAGEDRHFPRHEPEGSLAPRPQGREGSLG